MRFGSKFKDPPSDFGWGAPGMQELCLQTRRDCGDNSGQDSLISSTNVKMESKLEKSVKCCFLQGDILVGSIFGIYMVCSVILSWISDVSTFAFIKPEKQTNKCWKTDKHAFIWEWETLRVQQTALIAQNFTVGGASVLESRLSHSFCLNRQKLWLHSYYPWSQMFQDESSHHLTAVLKPTWLLSIPFSKLRQNRCFLTPLMRT